MAPRGKCIVHAQTGLAPPLWGFLKHGYLRFFLIPSYSKKKFENASNLNLGLGKIIKYKLRVLWYSRRDKDSIKWRIFRIFFWNNQVLKKNANNHVSEKITQITMIQKIPQERSQLSWRMHLGFCPRRHLTWLKERGGAKWGGA